MKSEKHAAESVIRWTSRSSSDSNDDMDETSFDSNDDMDETNLHTTTATVNNESKKERTDDSDDNDDQGPEKRSAHETHRPARLDDRR